MTWHEAITTGRAWDRERDQSRVRQAFVTLATTRRAWPAPTDFLDALPRPEQLKALPATPADPERAQAFIAEARRLLQVRQ